MEIFGITLNWVDFTALGLILVCFLFGVGTGLVMQVAGLFSVFAGMAAGFFAGPYLAGWLNPWIQKPIFANALGYFIAFILAAAFIRLVAYFLQSILEKFKIKRYDRLAGGVIGALKGALLCSILILIAGFAGTESLRQPIDASYSGRKIMAGAEWALEQPALKRIIDKLKGAAGASPEGAEPEPEAATT